MIEEDIRYRADGLEMLGRLFVPAAAAGAALPAVLVFPEAFGLGDHALSRARRLAGLGYVTLACDLHGGRERHMEMQAVLDRILPVRAEPSRLLARARAPLELLCGRAEVNSGRIAAIGYCIGGTIALELVRNGAPIRVAAGFHAGLSPVSSAKIARFDGRILMAVGANDPLIPPEERAAFEQEMRESGVAWQLNVYGGVVHSFTDPEADARGDISTFRHAPHADADAWEAMVRVLAEAL
jgi:dienelactone hydrolase